MPKYIVRRKLSLDSQEFYNKQITDFLVEEHKQANSSLVHVIKKKKGKAIIEEKKVYKGEVREHHPKSKAMIAETVSANPHLLALYKELAAKFPKLVTTFTEDQPSIHDVCKALIAVLPKIPPGKKHADDYHRFIVGAFTALFFPNLIQPHKEWDIHEGRKRIDIVGPTRRHG